MTSLTSNKQAAAQHGQQTSSSSRPRHLGKQALQTHRRAGQQHAVARRLVVVLLVMQAKPATSEGAFECAHTIWQSVVCFGVYEWARVMGVCCLLWINRSCYAVTAACRLAAVSLPPGLLCQS
jgi:hypothetical protein